ncbi:pore-forming ESAT-6 family protein [Paracoccus aestuariivivens]|uniref:DUF2501 domain-containing protein n=1 Tax=Paracoccus aestuariivivens TaxID=1820333 RepID=A0A6L6J9U3_9RHOB|nr:pore-forming ESAT-6 family protein [Paracoccus aestuariivivens]MTH77509.1 hypothetical protein [Paracoccus aestuariivivens]
MIARSAILPALAFTAITATTVLAQATVPASPDPAEATAQTPQATSPTPPDTSAAYESARNQLGVLTYCQDKGFIDAKAVETQTKLLAMIPAGDTAKGDAAETKGKSGTVSAMGVERSLSEAATEQKTTEDALCKQMDTLLQQLAAQIPS